MSVHARGKIRFLSEPELLKILEQTTARFENDKDSPALFHRLPKAYVDSLKNAIIAFEIEVRALENVFKLSQTGTNLATKGLYKSCMLKVATPGPSRKR